MSATVPWVNPIPVTPSGADPEARRFYVDAMVALDRASVDYVVGGGYAIAHYTGIPRQTKDLDLFIRPTDRDRALTTLTAAGYNTEFFFPFWIAKALHREAFIDLLYSSGNGQCVVDDEWFTHAVEADVLGHPTRLIPAEEQLWSKAFVQDRDRFDGADVAHLILCRGERFDWDRLLARFARHESVLLAHLILFQYIYPSERHRVPAEVVDRLWQAHAADPLTEERICRGTNLAARGYGTALRQWGFADGRRQPYGPLADREIEQLPEP